MRCERIDLPWGPNIPAFVAATLVRGQHVVRPRPEKEWSWTHQFLHVELPAACDASADLPRQRSRSCQPSHEPQKQVERDDTGYDFKTSGHVSCQSYQISGNDAVGAVCIVSLGRFSLILTEHIVNVGNEVAYPVIEEESPKGTQ